MRILVEYDWPGNVRELRNLVESMVVLAPGRVIRPEDIPAEVRFGSRREALLPVPGHHRPRQAGRAAPTATRPLPASRPRSWSSSCARCSTCGWTWTTFAASSRSTAPATATSWRIPAGVGGYVPFSQPLAISAPMPVAVRARAGACREPEEGTVVFRPGKTMADMEREAISAALLHSRGNRRRAAEMLGIGERTLYRKLKEYHLDV